MTRHGSAAQKRVFDILDLCIAQTECGWLEWKQAPGRRNAFVADLRSGTVEVGTEDDDGAEPFDFRIVALGESPRLVSDLFAPDDDAVQYVFRTLWQMVETRVRAADDALEVVLSELRERPTVAAK